MSQPNPLLKYYRQPKVYISLPSKGMHYPPGSLAGDYNNVPIFSMSGMDEILLKTPDALFNGDATKKVIESCCPFIKDAKYVPSIDIDALLVAIRIATYGENMGVSSTCPSCKNVSDYEIDLKGFIDHFNSLKFNSVLKLNELTINLRPLNYDENTQFNIENFKLQRMLYQLQSLPEEQQKEQLEVIYEGLGNIQVSLFLSSIESIVTPDSVVTDKEQIRDWLKNTDKDVYRTIKSALESNKETWSFPKQPIQCDHCSHEYNLEVTLDQSNFFV